MVIEIATGTSWHCYAIDTIPQLTEDGRNDTRQAQNQVDAPIHETVSGTSTNALVHGNSNVHDGTEWTSQNGTNQCTNTIRDHGFGDAAR